MPSREQITSFEQMRAEAMFASEQLVTGLKRLATVPDPDRSLLPLPESIAFPALYASLLPLATAFERLCKLGVIALAVNCGEPPPRVRNFSHRVTDLLGELAARAERFDWHGAPWGDAAARDLVDVVKRPWAASYLDLLDRYGAMDGRYEMIDGLARADESSSTRPLVFDRWTALPFDPLSERQQHLCAVRDLAHDLLDSDLIPAEGPSGEDAVELLRLTFSESRVNVAPTSLARTLRFQRLGSAVTGVLREASTLGFYRRTGGRLVFPDMSDVIEPGTQLNADSFVGLVVLGFADEDLALEAADSVFQLMLAEDE